MNDIQVCSFCQRKYGTISLLDRPIFRTFDHLISRNELKIRDIPHSKKNHGSMGSRRISSDEIENLIQICNECNCLKDNNTLNQFYSTLDKYYRHRAFITHALYLTPQIVKTIKNSINILRTTQSQPLQINIIQ